MARESFFHSLLRSVLLTLCTLVVVLGLVGGGVWLAMNQGGGVEDGTWLELDLYGNIHEYDTPAGPLGPVMGGDALTLQDMIDNLGKAALDDRIAGVIFRISSSNDAGWAKLQELRRAVDKVQEAGKPVYAWGDALNGRALFLAAGCDKVMMPEGGYFMFKGSNMQGIYLRGMLDKLGIKPHLHKIKDYKSAAEMIMNTEMSDANREMKNWMIGDITGVLMETLAAERGLTEEQLLAAMAYAEFMPAEAVEAGLIDEVVYLQGLHDRLKGEDDDRLKIVTHGAYAEESWDDCGFKGGDTVAVVHAQGSIGGRESRVDPLLGVMMGHESIVRELQRCRYDDDVKAVVFRVDSGGGESLASDLMAHEVELLAQVKPVVVSMVDVAASGGYYIAYKGTKMMADPLTITGSIGSINGFFNMKGFYEKIGVNKDGVAWGPMAELGTDMRDPTDEEWERHVDAHYKNFNAWMGDVGERRGISFEDMKTLAHGRVWTGRQAVENGLIDAVGNLDDAVALAAELAEMEDDKTPTLVHLPESQDLLASLMGNEPGVEDPVAMALRAAFYQELRTQASLALDHLESGALLDIGY